MTGNDRRIREARASDGAAIRKVHEDAFAGVDEHVPDLTMALLADETARPMLVLVAEVDGDVVGNVIFSTVRVSGCEQVSAYLLVPLAVAKRVQRQGLGRDMIETGLRMLHARGAKVVFVLGDPRYYGRFGFKPGHRVQAPYDLPYPEAWMARALPGASLEGLCGTLVCARSLNRPEYW